MSAKAAIESLKDFSAYRLSGMADTFSPDSNDSPGADLLTGVRDAVVESLLWALEQKDAEAELADLIQEWRDGEGPFEIADDAPSVYNQRRMEQLVDLGAYLNDISEYGESKDILTAAAYALYDVARQLIDALLDELEGYEEEEA